MSVHYEIRCTIHGEEWPLAESLYPKSFDKQRPAKQFATRGGAKNYIYKWQLDHARIVRVSSNDGAPK